MDGKSQNHVLHQNDVLITTLKHSIDSNSVRVTKTPEKPRSFSPCCVGLHIQTETDWQTVTRPSDTFETELANAYLVNDVRGMYV